MKLNEVLEQLSVGEFSQLSIGGAAAGVLDATNYSKVVPHINLGLTALFTRFTLKEGRIQVTLQDAQTTYKLTSAYAVNGAGTEPVRYIIDTVSDPFVDDILKIEKVLTDAGDEIGLNDAADPWSIKTPSATTIQVHEDIVANAVDLPDWLETDGLAVVYRANHPKIVIGVGFDPALVDVLLPPTHLEALLYFVASRVNNPIGMTNEFHAGNSYAAKYEMVCQILEGKGMQVDQGGSNMKAVQNGWV